MFRTKFGIVNLFRSLWQLNAIIYGVTFWHTVSNSIKQVYWMLMCKSKHIQTTQYPSQLAINYSKCSTYSSPKWKQNDIYWVNIWTHFFFILSTSILYVLYVIFFYKHPDGDLFYSIDFRVNYWRSTFKFYLFSYTILRDRFRVRRIILLGKMKCIKGETAQGNGGTDFG